MSELLVLIYRTAILYAVALVVFRLMGKRTLAKMGPFDFAVIIMIGEAVAIGMQDAKTPLWHAVGVTVALGILQYVLTWLNVRFRWLERITQGTPTRLIFRGQVDDKRLMQERISDSDLVMELRQKSVTNLSDVEEAFLEPTGAISVKKVSQKKSGDKGGGGSTGGQSAS